MDKQIKNLVTYSEFPVTNQIARVQLPDGMFLDIGNCDHRVLENYANDGDWKTFIELGCATVHWAWRVRSLWMRTSGLTEGQQNAWRYFYEFGGFRVASARFEIFEGRNCVQVYDDLKDPELIRLFLTDSIAFQLACREKEVEAEQFREYSRE